MTQAQYSFQNAGRTYFASVTLKDDGKTSFSIPDAKRMSAATRYQIKALGQQIVAAQFDHPSITHLLKEERNDKLVTQLLEKTAELKERIIAQTKIYAANMFAHYQEVLKRTEAEWYDAFGVKWEMRKLNFYETVETVQPLKGEYNRKNIYRMRDAKQKAKDIVAGGIEKLEAKELKAALDHYKFSIEKLAYRLHQNGVSNESKFEILTAWVKVNLEITIKYEGGILRAWTIIAEGPIQRAHYRYLIK